MKWRVLQTQEVVAKTEVLKRMANDHHDIYCQSQGGDGQNELLSANSTDSGPQEGGTEE